MPRRRNFSGTGTQQKSDITIDVYRAGMGLKDLQSLRRTLAKRANQRLVRLERASSKITGEGYSEYGAAQIAYDYLEVKGSGKKRFTERANAITDSMELRREITVLQGFLGSKSSTVVGQRDIERKRIQAFETGKWGQLYKMTGQTRKPIKFASNKEFYNFLQSSAFRGLVKAGFTSEQVLEKFDEALERTPEDGEEIMKKMEEALQAYRDGEKMSVKDLESRLGMKRLK